MSNSQQHSTPSKNKLSSKSKAGNTDFLQRQIKDEIKADAENALKCDFDDLLKWFLFLVLDKHSEEKKKLDILQHQIEQLQEERYYLGTTGLGENLPATAKENELVSERTKILDILLEESLKNVLPVANDPQVRKHLGSFSSALENSNEKETTRYAPYVLLCNTALEKLTPLSMMRKSPAEFKAVFHCNDPSVFKTEIPKMPAIERKPDVVTTSFFAAADVATIEIQHYPNLQTLLPQFFSQAPSKPFQWPQNLSSTEFKVLKRTLSAQASGVNKAAFKFKDTKRVWIVEHDHLMALDNDSSLPQVTEEVPDGTPAAAGQSRDSAPARKSQRVKPNSNSKHLTSENVRSSQTNVSRESHATDAVGGRVQLASYALEQLSYNIGVHHVINSLFIDEYLSVWYYDRQGIIGTNGISVIADFPRFLVLLLAFQQFSIEDWGVIPCLNPTALRMHGITKIQEEERPVKSHSTRDNPYYRFMGDSELRKKPVSKVTLNSTNENVTDRYAREDYDLQQIVIDMDQLLSHRPRTIAGRATSVLVAEGIRKDKTQVEMVCKIYHPEVRRRHEGETLKIIHRIANIHDAGMAKHMPTLYFYVDIQGCTTQRVRSMVNQSWKGHRTLRIICSKRLKKITTISGLPFVKAWLDAATCHAFLWRHRVEHGDPSLDNIMYDPDNECGVLADYDLSILQWEERRFASERTGTIPFMALELLSKKYWDGKIQRRFHHELESFIWMLPYVFLLYQNNTRQKNEIVDVWRTSDYAQCYKEKRGFYDSRLDDAEETVQNDFKELWGLANELCLKLARCHTERAERRNDIRRKRYKGTSSHETMHEVESEALWDAFIGVLKDDGPEDQAFSGLVGRMEKYKPDFRDVTTSEKEELRAEYDV